MRGGRPTHGFPQSVVSPYVSPFVKTTLSTARELVQPHHEHSNHVENLLALKTVWVDVAGMYARRNVRAPASGTNLHTGNCAEGLMVGPAHSPLEIRPSARAEGSPMPVEPVCSTRRDSCFL